MAEVEIVEDAGNVGGDFSPELKEKVLKRDRRRCQICGAELEATGLDIHHVKPRGMGGSESKNVKSNLITVCRSCHDDLEAGRKIIKKWNPADKEKGFQVRSNEKGQFRALPDKKLYFYQMPNEELIEEAYQKHQKAINYIKSAFQKANQSIELFIEIKQEKLFRHIQNEEGEFYQNFGAYYQEQVINQFSDRRQGPLSLSSINSYISSFSIIRDKVPKEKRIKIPRGIYGDLASLLRDNNIPNDEKSFAIQSAQQLDEESPNNGSQEEFKRLKKSLKTEYSNATKVKNCKDCIVPEKIDINEFQHQGKTYKLGDVTWHRCPVSEKIIESISREGGERIAEDCSEHQGVD